MYDYAPFFLLSIRVLRCKCIRIPSWQKKDHELKLAEDFYFSSLMFRILIFLLLLLH